MFLFGLTAFQNSLCFSYLSFMCASVTCSSCTVFLLLCNICCILYVQLVVHGVSGDFVFLHVSFSS